ncbi:MULTISPECIES: flagellar basal-body MS-ring/collar protein FliF [unclassified Paenibacillus]|uniref:flagellar basal-body MS-ring/collar protein FliF n=1 Tax=unclassified Paenibacillus TaxID=185978 RepID=UPI00070AFF7F|nr:MULTISPECIES: flagellar basal-body MS-ring/collar protein FliF [unclassified Paenibacillus]KQX69193.1 flagellar M-ring protein FliF [Paenibacillus sp. Root444D2]KRE51739.1 flagellar M-ring protein FliF [Paenibacillus sp. Soil724D2]
MNENLLQYWEKVKQYWNRYSRTTKITFIATVVLLILTAAIISINLSKTEYSLAFTELQPSDASAIKSYLDTAKIPYHLSDDGKSIEVPTSEVANVKLGVESQGLNKNGSLGFGAFSNSSSFGITDNEFKVKYLNAIQGELQQLINANQAIASSKVLISLPEEGPFLQQQQEKATASVVVQTKQGYTLDQAKVDTIYNLVSHSVKNLPLENITISDQYGQSLVSSKVGGTSSTSLVTSQVDINNQFRNDLQKNINTMLGTMFGRDKVNVSVFSTMNFDQKKSKEQLVSAPNQVDQKGLEISLQEASESYQNNGADTGGVPGTGTTDVPGYPGAASSGKSNSEKNNKTVNYEVNRITNDIISTPYVVKDLSINVGIEPPVIDDPNSLTAETKAAVQSALVNIVRTALADNKVTYTDADLQKKVTVFAHSFARPADTLASKTTTYLTYAGLALAALAIGLIAGFAIRKRRKAAQQQLEQEMNIAAGKAELPTIDIENVTNDNQVRKQLETLAKKRPEDFVNLLRTWLVDE